MKFITNFFDYYFGGKLGSRIQAAVIDGSLASLLSKGSQVIAFMFCASILGPEEFGRLMILFGLITSFLVLSEAGLSTTIIKYISQYRNKSPDKIIEIINCALIISLISLILIVLFIISFEDFITVNILADISLNHMLRLGAIIIVFWTITNIGQSVLYGFEKYNTIKVINVYIGLITLVTLPVCSFFYGVDGVLYGLLITKAINSILVYRNMISLATSNKMSYDFKFGDEIFYKMLNFSIPTLLNSILIGPIMLISLSLVAHEDNGHFEIGVYSAAYQWFSLLIFLPGVMTQSILPIVSEQIQAGEMLSVKELLIKKIKLITCFIAPVALLLIVMSPLIMNMYGDSYERYWYVLIFILIAVLIASPQGIMGNYIVSQDMVWHWFISSFLWALTLLIITYNYSYYGALCLSLGLIAAYTVKGIVAIWLVFGVEHNREAR